MPYAFLFVNFLRFLMVRVILPFHLRTLAKVGLEVELDVSSPVTVHSILTALEAQYPMLRGTIRDHGSNKRRAFLRYHACSEDISFQDPDVPLPDPIASGQEPFMVIGAIAGG